MRDILFKAKRIDNGEWVRGGYSYCKKDDTHFITQMSKDHISYIGRHQQVDPNTICQYTGLTDKNGNKIWENDVVEYRDCTNEKYVVAWEASKAMFEHQQYSCSIMNFDELSGMEVEVIGNIFDNAELLEGQVQV